MRHLETGKAYQLCFKCERGVIRELVDRGRNRSRSLPSTESNAQKRGGGTASAHTIFGRRLHERQNSITANPARMKPVKSFRCV